MSTYRLYILKTLEDHKDADSFLALTKQRLKTIKSHKFTWWDPSLLLPGDDREAELVVTLTPRHATHRLHPETRAPASASP